MDRLQRTATGRPFSSNRTRCGRDPPSRGGQRYPEIKQRGFYSGKNKLFTPITSLIFEIVCEN